MGFIGAKGKVHSNTSLPQETRKNQINNLTLHLKQLEKEEMRTPGLVGARLVAAVCGVTQSRTRLK